jgi:hypothetical protein
LKYRVGGDSTWHKAIDGKIPRETAALMFTAHLEGASAARAVNVLVEVYKISAPGAADSDTFFRQQLFAVNRAGGESVAVDHGHDDRVSVVVDTHDQIVCPDCTAQHPGARLERVGLRPFDHLGQGPYEASVTVSQSDATSAAAAPDDVNKASMFFQAGSGPLAIPGVGSGRRAQPRTVEGAALRQSAVGWRSRPRLDMMPAKFPFQRTRTE